MLKAALADPQIRQSALKTLTSAANACAAPGCSGKSPVACQACNTPMCLTHAVFRVKPAGPICVDCLAEVWGLADAEEPEENPKKKRSRR